MLRQTNGVSSHISAVTEPEPCGGCAVRSVSVCRAVPSAMLSALADHLVEKRYGPGEAIVFDGDNANAVFTITEGTAKIFKSLADGRRAITGFLFPGDFLGFVDGDVFHFGAEALTELKACRFPRSAFQDLLARIPGLEGELLERATHEIDAAQEQILLLSRKTAMEKVASLIQSLARRSTRFEASGDGVRFSMTRSDMADYLGLTTETVSRVFSKLKSDRIIQLLDPSTARVLRPERLAQIAGGDEG